MCCSLVLVYSQSESDLSHSGTISVNGRSSVSCSRSLSKMRNLGLSSLHLLMRLDTAMSYAEVPEEEEERSRAGV